MITKFEAQELSRTHTQAIIAKAEAAGADGDLFRCAVSLLVDLALKDSQAETPLRVSLRTALRDLNRGDEDMNPRREFALLHSGEDRETKKGGTQRRRRGQQPYGETLTILSGLAWHLQDRTDSPHYSWLAELAKRIYPPIFLKGVVQQNWRKLSSAIRKSRENRGNGGRDDYRALASTCSGIKPMC